MNAARATLEGRKPRQMAEVEAMGLVAKWFAEEDAERSAALEATQSPLMDIDGALAEIDALDAEALQAIAEADFHAVRPLALQLMSVAGLKADVKSKVFGAFMAALQRGRRQLLVLERKRLLRDFTVQPSDPVITRALAGAPMVLSKVRILRTKHLGHSKATPRRDHRNLRPDCSDSCTRSGASRQTQSQPILKGAHWCVIPESK